MNAVLDGSPRRCNGVVLARLRAAATRAKSHVIHCWTGLLGYLSCRSLGLVACVDAR